MELFEITGFQVNRTNVKMNNYFTKQLKQFEITPEQWGILSVLDSDKATTQKDLAETIDRDQTTIVRMIHSLEKKEIVKRVVNDTDKRSHNLYLTAKGVRLKSKVLPVVLEAHNHVTRYLSMSEISELKVILEKLYASVKDE
ncbi:MarR family winged helix-turn-helix transcriptional regulator [Paenibacillus qinlingensis]|uniref:DNA-binding MarR family transcriptional regulator n=1 Tax=Paenibacillus qinlingensis TaxID=1837343 RepID=A0ABU1NYN6_9BACL|nr:MarR family winged helix-turn-helix transcriptional regulator [Paenibacillus qinlingensis]MDR6551947.1 DNA-binding MarR family transcriptional regulator [Paenibacillus qinlingensis]